MLVRNLYNTVRATHDQQASKQTKIETQTCIREKIVHRGHSLISHTLLNEYKAHDQKFHSFKALQYVDRTF